MDFRKKKHHIQNINFGGLIFLSKQTISMLYHFDQKSDLTEQLSGSGVFFYIEKLAILAIFRTFWYIELHREIAY